MSGVTILLGGIQIDDADFGWSLYTGAAIDPVVITVDAYRTGEFELLPYITTLAITASGQDGTVDPAMETVLIDGVRVIEVRKLNDLATEIYLGDVRVDLARRVFPADFMMRWRDGYLFGTYEQTFAGAVQYLAELIPELAAALAGDAFDELQGADFELPNDVVQAGTLLLPGLEALAGLVGTTISVGSDGLIRFPKADNDSAFPVAAYSWVDDMSPSWAVQSRTKRGLPAKIRAYYPERHQLVIGLNNPSATSTGDSPLDIDLEWVYGFGEGYGTLDELLVYYGFEAGVLSEEQIAEHFTSANFEGTAVERDGSSEADDIVSIIKRDWRQTLRLLYRSGFGRRGGWTDIVPGRLKYITDKDGDSRFAIDPSASPVEAEWVQWHDTLVDPNPGDTNDLYGCIIARGHVKEGTVVPPAPFTIEPVGGHDDVYRLRYNQKEENTSAAFIGRLKNGGNSHLITVTGSGAEDDTGNHVEHSFGLYIQELSELRLEKNVELRVYFVATRQLPNTFERWTPVDVEGFADADVELQEIEVGSELFALYGEGEYDNAFPQTLNLAEIQADADRRVRIMKEDMSARLSGEGVAQGVAPVIDYVYPHGPVSRMDIMVDDSTVVFTRVIVGNRDTARARWDRSQKRKISRRRDAGGVPRV